MQVAQENILRKVKKTAGFGPPFLFLAHQSLEEIVAVRAVELSGAHATVLEICGHLLLASAALLLLNTVCPSQIVKRDFLRKIQTGHTI